MKKLSILLLILSGIHAFSQNIDPMKRMFRWGGTNGPYINLSPDTSLFQQKEFMLGVQWGAPPRITKALMIKQRDGEVPADASNFVDSCNYFLLLREQTHNCGPDLFNVRAIQYEPTLALEPNNPTKLNKRDSDTTNPIFGFLYRRGKIINDPYDPNFNRLILQGDSLRNQVVLSKAWPQTEFNRFGLEWHSDKDTINYPTLDSFLCRTLYFSINLRRNDAAINNDTLLKIELPYSSLEDSSYTDTTTHHQTVRRWKNIQFDLIPSSISGDYYQIQYDPTKPSRGKARNVIQAPYQTRAFYITKNMLPPNNEDITISALFRCDNNINPDDYSPPHGNPVLKEKDNTLGIDSIDIKVTFLDTTNTQVEIDWVRIETPHAQRYLRGYYDNSMCVNLQNKLDDFTAPEFLSRGIRPFRLVGWVEGGMYHWAAQRYYHKLIGNITTKEECPYLPEHYEYYVDSPDRWFNTGNMNGNVSNPFCREKVSLDSNDMCMRAMQLGYGYKGLRPTDGGYVDYLQDTAFIAAPATAHNACNYEVMLPFLSSLLKITYFLDHAELMNNYIQTINVWGNNWAASPMIMLENISYGRFYDPTAYSYLYSDKNWWGHLFLMTDLITDTVKDTKSINYGKLFTFVNSKERFYTPEEYKANAWMTLIRGAKGLIYDGVETSPFNHSKLQFYDGGCIESSVKTTLEALPDEEFITSDMAGPDYIRTSGEILDLNNRLFFLDTIALFMDRPVDKVYLGRKSMRWEVYKLHKYIRQVEPTLMNLRLQAHYMKGFREWKNQRHEYYPLDIFYDFVEVSGVRTKAYYNDQFEGTPQYNYRDSSFYDISLLSDLSVDSNMTKVFYLGVLNRRTNPLVMEDDTLQFYPTYEWDLNVRNGGERLWGQAEDSLYWREKFWQRMGCREIQIPFQYRHGTDNPSTKLRVVELGFDNPEIKSWNWRQPEYYHTVDTVISWDETLSARFLPGEGKILKVTPVNFGESGVDTCQGCEALKNHVRASATPVRCEGLQHKWDVTLENLSGCDYDNLSLIVKSDDNSAQYLNVGAGNTGFTINQEIANGQRVWTLQGALAQGAEVTFPFSISSAYSVDYQITWGEWVDGMLIECDSALLSGRVVKSDCELIGVTVTDTGDSCLCGAEWKPSEKEITIFVPDTQPCVEEVKITRFLPHINPPLIEELTLAGDGVHVEADSGTYLTFRFCPWEDWQVKVQLFSGDDKLCESEFKSPVCDCDTIKITSIWNMIYPSNDKLGYKFDFRKIIDCATAYDVAEVLPNGALAVVKPNVAIPDTGISGEWLSSADFEFRKYIIIAKNRDCAPPCYSDTIKVPPKHWTNPAQINTTANFLVDSLPCMAGIIATRDDTLSKEIYGITVFEGREPYALLYSEMRNPASQPPIDLRVPGGYHITNIVFPCDSALKLIVKYWDEDTVCVAVGEIDTTCGSGDDYEYLESLSAYPNPASEEVTLDYEMKKGAHVELEIIDAQGNTKKKSIKAFKDKGKHSLTFQLDGLQTGIYYVALRAEGEAMARRIVIIK